MKTEKLGSNKDAEIEEGANWSDSGRLSACSTNSRLKVSSKRHLSEETALATSSRRIRL